ncbi:hypothetical protein BMETH_677_1 [methanotrophic bacterial endosymbiont of Bathymodiolus sp.]|nr:hypothetical protein BMETH_677_1 [methanotrophic bacterial endosymbiont of Bathymodiolus sp.]
MTMKHIFFILVIQFLTLNTASSNEQNSVFDGTILNVPIVSSTGQSEVYQDVKFKVLDSNKWELFDYKKAEPMEGIDSVDLVLLTKELPIRGFLKVRGVSPSCIAPGVIRSKLVGNTIEVFMGGEPPVPRGPLFCLSRMVKSFFSKLFPYHFMG